MTVFRWAELDDWAKVSDRRLTFIARQATNDMLKEIKIAPGINRGGSRKKGTVPRDLGALANSLQSSVLGSTAFTGRRGWRLAIGTMQAGDTIEFAWGGAVAPYAAAVHYGANGVMGTFWIDVAAGKWTSYVRGAIMKGKAVK